MKATKVLCGILTCAILFGNAGIVHAKETQSARNIPALTAEMMHSQQECLEMCPQDMLPAIYLIHQMGLYTPLQFPMVV